jgi:hypothetical protein
MPRVDSVQEQIDAISRMSPRQLTSWITDRLEGHDILLEHDEENSPSYPIIAISRHLSGVVVEAIHQATVGLVRAWIKESSSAGGEELLILVQGLRVTTVREDLEYLARSEQFQMLAAGTQYRVLQTLIALEANLEPNFWRRVFDGAPTTLSGVAFDGLALVSPNHAIDFLSLIPNNASAVEQIAIALPGFMDNVVPARERTGVRNLIEARLPEMQPLLSHAITEFFAAEETPLSVLPLVQAPSTRREVPRWPISLERFPALFAFGAGSEQLLRMGPDNPARMFAALAHQ